MSTRPTRFGGAIVALALAAVSVSAQGESGSDESASSGLPLKADRFVSITTDEASWLSLDVSPDGQTIVFDVLGDLYLIPFAGGAAAPLTEGIAYDSQPRFSPDGTRIVFVSDRDGAENLWVLDISSGDLDQITEGKTSSYESPEWLPDGQYIVASRTTGSNGESRIPKLWMWHVDGGSGIQLITEPDNLRTTGAAPTPDGRYIWFAQRTGLWQYNAILPQYQLAVYDRDSGERYVRSDRYGSAFRPTISPDGRWLVYGTRHEDETGLRVRELRTGDERWLAYPVQRDDQESVASSDVLPGMSFTPDSTELVASYGGKIWRVPLDGSEPAQIPFEVGVELPLGPELAFTYPIGRDSTFTVRQIRDAVPSPTLDDRLAFAALDRLYVTTLPDGTPARVTDLEVTEAQPAWSPDGSWIAFVTWSPAGGQVFKVPAAGGVAVQLTTTPAIYQQPAWSPDGRRIVVIQGPARSYREAASQSAPGTSENIVWVSSDGGDTTMVAPADGRATPHFSADPDRIYLYHAEEGLVSVRWDGTDEKHHIRVTGRQLPGVEDPVSASRILIGPDETRAIAQVSNDLYVVEVPYVGGETPTVSVTAPDRAIVPVRRLTDVGGQFPAWGQEGRRVHWSIGNAHLVYDLEDARAAEDAADAASDDAQDGPRREDEQDDDADETEAREPVYEPREHRILIEAVRDIGRGRVVLRGARVVTMVGSQVIERADIVVEDGRIADVGRRGSIDFPDGTRIIDLSGTTIVPGFVDTHAHLRPSFGVHKMQSWAYLANLAYGVTTTRDPQTGSTDVLTYGDMVEAGMMVGPRIYSTGPGVFLAEQIEDLDHARDILTRYSSYYDTKTIKMYMSGNRQQRQWIIMAAREQHLLPTTEGGLDLKYNLEMLIDGYPGQEHAFPVTPLYEDVVTLTARSGLAYTPTLIVSYGGPFGENYFYTRENPHDDPKLRRFTPHDEIDRRTRRRGAGTGPGPGGWFMDEEHVFMRHARTANEIVRAGGRVAVGSHGQLQGLGYHWELWMIHSGGLSEHDALRVATLLGAESIGLGADLGSIQAGKLADLVVLDENPLEDIRHTTTVRQVMKNGRLYDADTLDEVWPRERPLGELTWLDDDPTDVAAGLR